MTIDPTFDAMLDGLCEPAIWLRRTNGVARGSKLGGLPGLPRGVAWPRHGRTKLPLHFLAQIDLAKLPPTPLAGGPAGHRLPVKGALFFFADIEEEMLWDYEERSTAFEATRVVFAPEIGVPVTAPSDLPEINHPYGKDGGPYAAGIRVYPEAALDAFVIDTYAGAEAYFQGDASRQADMRTLRSIERATGASVPVYSGMDQHMTFMAEPAAVRETARPDGSKAREVRFKRHQMLGAATNVQGSANAARGSGLVPLLQLDTDWGLHKTFMFCDMGMAQFWTKPEDLRERRFERAWASTEGG